jgi:hypothetical protein
VVKRANDKSNNGRALGASNAPSLDHDTGGSQLQAGGERRWGHFFGYLGDLDFNLGGVRISLDPS